MKTTQQAIATTPANAELTSVESGRTCAYCRETLPAHTEGSVHSDCATPYEVQVAAILADEESEQLEVMAEMHAQLDRYWLDVAADAELESAHDLDCERVLAGVA